MFARVVQPLALFHLEIVKPPSGSLFSLSPLVFEQQYSSFHITPDEGWMERRQAHSFFLLSRVRGATPALVRRGPSRCDRDPFRRSTVALSSCGPTLPFRQWDTGSGSDCPRQAMNARRSGSEPPAVRFAPQPRDATPGSVSRIVSGRRPLLSQDANLVSHIRYVVNSEVTV